MSSRRTKVLLTILALLVGLSFVSPAPPPPLRLSIRGTQYALPGEEPLLRATVWQVADRTPVAGSLVTIARADGAKTVLCRGTTTREGSVILRVPPLADDHETTLIATADQAPPVLFPLVSRERHHLVLTTDRSFYQPNETVLSRGLIRRLPDLRPGRNLKAELSIRDPDDRVSSSRKIEADRFGLISSGFDLPGDAKQGTWAAVLGVAGQTTRLRFEVGERHPPLLDVQVEVVGGPHCTWGDTVVARLAVHSRHGEPSAGAAVCARIVATGSTLSIVERHGILHRDGDARLALPLPLDPPATIRGDEERSEFVLDIRVKDSAGNEAGSQRTIRVARLPLLIGAQPEHGLWMPDVPQRVQVYAQAPDGTRRSCRFRVRHRSGDDEGEVPALLVPVARSPEAEIYEVPAGKRSHRLSVVALEGSRAVHREFAFRPAGPEEYSVAAEPVQPSRLGTVRVTAVAASPTVLQIDVYHQGRLIAAVDREVAGTRSAIDVPLPPATRGELLLQVRRTIGRSEAARELGVVLADEGGLGVEVRPEKPVYRPGEKAALNVRVTGGDDPCAPVVLGLAVLDRASVTEPFGPVQAPRPKMAPFQNVTGEPRPEVGWFTDWTLPRIDLFTDFGGSASTLLFYLLLLALPYHSVRAYRLRPPRQFGPLELKKMEAACRIGLCLVFLLVVGLAVYVLPQFKSVFNSMNVELPTVTKLILALSDFIQEFGLVVLLSYFALDAFIVRLFRRAAQGRAGLLPLASVVVHNVFVLSGIAILLLLAMAMGVFMPMLKLINCVDGGTSPGAGTAPTVRMAALPTQEDGGGTVRKAFLSTLLAVPELEVGATRVARVELPATDSITVYEARVDAHDLIGGWARGTGAISYTLPLYGRLVMPRLLRTGDRTRIKAVVFSSLPTPTRASVELSMPWGKQTTCVGLLPRQARLVTFDVEPRAAGELPVRLTVTAPGATDRSESSLNVLPQGQVFSRVIEGAWPMGRTGTIEVAIPVPTDLVRSTPRLAVSMVHCLKGWQALVPSSPAAQDTPSLALALIANRMGNRRLPPSMRSGLVPGADPWQRAQSALRTLAPGSGRTADPTWASILAASALRWAPPDRPESPDGRVPLLPMSGLVGRPGHGQPETFATAMAITVLLESGVERRALEGMTDVLMDGAEGAVEGPYQAALFSNLLAQLRPDHPVVGRLIDVLDKRRRPVHPMWLPERPTLAGGRLASQVETVSLAITALLAHRRDGATLDSLLVPLRWVIEHPTTDPVAALAATRALCLATERLASLGGRPSAELSAAGPVRAALDGTWTDSRTLGVEEVHDLLLRPVGPGTHRVVVEGKNLSGWIHRIEISGQAVPAESGYPGSTLSFKGGWSRASISLRATLGGSWRIENRSAYDSGPLTLEVPLPCGFDLDHTVPAAVHLEGRVRFELDSIPAGGISGVEVTGRAVHVGRFQAPPASLVVGDSGECVPLTGRAPGLVEVVAPTEE
jgi:hypothetical protein